MLKSFIEKILSLAPANLLEIDERRFTDQQIFPIVEPEVKGIECHTLTGLIDFYDALPLSIQERVIFHVQDFDKVSIVSDIFGVEKQRETFITANAYKIATQFNGYLSHEDFMVYILSGFVQDETTAKVLLIIGNLKVEAGAHITDDGHSQTVTAKTGITKVENVELPNPIVLRPFRTFSDIEQPASNFILRLKQGDGVKAALFEADGGAWKNTAIANIKSYLETRKIGAKIIA